MVSDSYDEFNVTKRYDHTFAVYIRGDSMVGAGIEDDDIAVFREQDFARNGQVVYACVNGMCTVKVYRNDKGGTRLVPANPKYAPIVVNSDDDLVIRGVLLNIVREPKLLGDI
jgi:repressor LexA